MGKIMKSKVYFTLYSLVLSLVLVLVTTCFFQFVYPPTRDAMASDRYACIRQDLNALITSGNVGENKEFTVAYELPTCYATNGYSLTKTYIYDGNMVAVTYKNPDFKQGVQGGSGSSGGGMGPIQ